MVVYFDFTINNVDATNKYVLFCLFQEYGPSRR
jgi:hypothetical protein